MNNSEKTRLLTLLATVLWVCAAAAAQEIDLNEPLLDGLELDYRGKASASSKVTLYDDLTWWTLFGMRQKGWNGGEGCYSTPLPDGNVFWSFGPSTFGRISEFRDRKKYNNNPCNAAMIQTATDEHILTDDDFLTLNPYISTDPAKESSYYRGKTWIRHPDATLSESTLNRGRTDTDHRYLPGDAHVLLKGGRTVLQVVLFGIDEAGDYTDISIAEYALDGTPGDEGYMQLVTLHKDVVPFRVGYGMRLLEDGGHVYLYGTYTAGNRGYTWPVVARTATLDLLDAWEYYVTDADGVGRWQRAVPTIDEIQQSAIAGTDRVEAPNVFRYGDAYYMLTLNGPSGMLSLWQSATPWGPFGKKKNIIAMPADEKATSNLFVHPQLSRMGEIVFSYTMSPVDVTIWTKKSDGSYLETLVSGSDRCYNAWGSASLNVPHFRRLFGWQTLYSLTPGEPLADAGLLSYADMLSGIVSPTSGSNSADAPWQLITPDGILIQSGRGTPVLPQSLPTGIYILTRDMPDGRKSEKILISADK